MKKYASEFFNSGKGHCAQAVAAAWQRKTASRENLHDELSGFGHGKAPGGICGALYAVHRVTDKESADKLSDKFSQAAGGSSVCKVIRYKKILKCNECVEVAADLLEEHLDSQKPEKI
jgi:Putative redox-active protein (C_GCAxxG_C_C)